MLLTYSEGRVAAPRISREVRDFVARFLPSVEHLETSNLVMAATIGPMHDFAEAFRIKKGKSNA